MVFADLEKLKKLFTTHSKSGLNSYRAFVIDCIDDAMKSPTK